MASPYQTPAYQTPAPWMYQTPRQSVAPRQSVQPSGSVLGASTQASQVARPAQPTQSGADTGRQENLLNRISEETNKAAEEQRKAQLAAINSEYQSILGSLGAQEQSLNTQLPLTLNELNTQAGQSQSEIERLRSEQLAGLSQGETQAQQATTGVLNKARQTYNELLSGASRFGGSAQQAFGELLGRQTAGTMGDAQTNLQNTLSQIAGERTRTNQFYNDKITSLVQNRDNAIAKARQEYQSEINKINASRTEAQSNKAARNLQALADFRTRVSEITDSVNTQKIALDQWKQEQEKTLSAVKDFAGNPFIPQVDQSNVGIDVSGFNKTTPGYQTAQGIYNAGVNIPNQDKLRDILFGGL